MSVKTVIKKTRSCSQEYGRGAVASDLVIYPSVFFLCMISHDHGLYEYALRRLTVHTFVCYV